MPTQTTLLSHEGKETTMTGTSGFTVTSTRAGDDFHVEMVFDIRTKEEAISMMGALLSQLEALHGEGFVTACIASYAIDTNKQFVSSPMSDYQVGILRGDNPAAKRYRS